MLGRILLGAGASASALLAGAPVAHAQARAEKAGADAADIPPVYDDELPAAADPLPGTIVPAQPAAGDGGRGSGSRLADAQAELAKRLETERVEAQGRVYRVSRLLQGYVGRAREALDAQLQRAEVKGQEWSHRYRESERSAASTVASLRAEREEVLPEAIYVLVAGLAGSIAVRRRTFLLRATVPWAVGGAAFAYLLPQTWTNVRSLAWHWEQEQLPTLAARHAQADRSLRELARESRDGLAAARAQLKGGFDAAREQIRAWLGH